MYYLARGRSVRPGVVAGSAPGADLAPPAGRGARAGRQSAATSENGAAAGPRRPLGPGGRDRASAAPCSTDPRPGSAQGTDDGEESKKALRRSLDALERAEAAPERLVAETGFGYQTCCRHKKTFGFELEDSDDVLLTYDRKSVWSLPSLLW